MPTRFDGAVAFLRVVEVADLVRWVVAIPFADWHQQKPLDDGQLRPAMMTDPAWHDFGEMAAPVIAQVLPMFRGCAARQLMLSVVMPGHAIEPHRDAQPPHWICRVHVPLTSNEASRFIVGGQPHQLEVGKAYAVNTEVEHAVENGGATPRIHLMTDIVRHHG